MRSRLLLEKAGTPVSKRKVNIAVAVCCKMLQAKTITTDDRLQLKSTLHGFLANDTVGASWHGTNSKRYVYALGKLEVSPNLCIFCDTDTSLR